MHRWIAGTMVCLAWVLPALAENRVALVIGEDEYQNVEPLKKAVADANAYTDLLAAKGFQVRSRRDLTYKQMNAEIAAFVASIEPGDIAVFVYSGHGWSDGAINYLVGVDAPRSASEDELAGITLPLKNGVNGVLDRIERKGAQLRVAIVDACRDNPFAPPTGTKGFSYGRGLAPMAPPPAGTFVVFSASAGESALDRLSDADASPNSVFTRVFLPHLAADMTLLDATKATQAEVVSLTSAANRAQKPAYYDEVVGAACLTKECKVQGAIAPSHSDQALAAMIEHATTAEALKALVSDMPEGELRDRARAKLEALRNGQAASLEKPEAMSTAVAPTIVTAAPTPAGSASVATLEPGLVPAHRVQGRAAMLVAVSSNPQKPAVSLGSVVWSTIPAAPGQPATIAVKAEADIPELKMHAVMTLRKNTDLSLPASHTIDLRVTFADGAEIKGIKDMRVPMMRRDDPPSQDALSGVRVKISDSYFLVGLNRSDAELAHNVDLIVNRGWFDFPMLLNDDRIAKLTLEKGSAADRLFADAFLAWKAP
jgi:hypothetical protein